jgi:hypothetical protein
VRLLRKRGGGPDGVTDVDGLERFSAMSGKVKRLDFYKKVWFFVVKFG